MYLGIEESKTSTTKAEMQCKLEDTVTRNKHGWNLSLHPQHLNGHELWFCSRDLCTAE